jgi:hypothetical protein
LILHTLERVIEPEGKTRFVLPCRDNRDVAEVESTPLEGLVSLVANRSTNGLPQFSVSERDYLPQLRHFN